MENRADQSTQKTYFWNRIKSKDKAIFYEHLSNLVEWWVTVIDALWSFLEKTQNPKMAKEILNLLIFIDSGDNFSTWMKKLPEVFDKKEVAIIESWESSWTMQKSFENLAVQLREEEELRQKAKSALIYPLIIMIFLVIAVLVIMTFVIPKLSDLFTSAQVELPFATRSLIFVSNFVINNFYLIIFFFILVFISYRVYISTYSWKRFFDSLYLRIPLVWTIYRNYIIAQISSNLWLLIWSWIPIIKTLRLTWEWSNNAIYWEAISIISDKVASWKKITQSIEETDPQHLYFPNDFIQIIAAWEKTSTINKVCVKLKEQYRREVEYSIWMLIKWIEPAAILIAWIFVLWFAFAIFSAVLKITETVW